MEQKRLSQVDIIRIAAQAGVKAALDTLEKEKKKEGKQRSDKRLRNTKLLLRNYRMFKEHTANDVLESEQLEEIASDIHDLMWEYAGRNERYVESIKKSVERTRIIMTHIRDMLALYETYCQKSARPEDRRRYRVVYAMYIADEQKSTHEVAQQEGIDDRTVYKDVDAACEKLSALIFGIDGIRPQ